MAAYIIAHLDVHDPEGAKAYQQAVPPLIAKAGGRYLVRAGDVEVLEGDWRVPRLVVIEFPDRDAAKRFYESSEYQEILPLRLQSCTGDLVIAEGCQAPPR